MTHKTSDDFRPWDAFIAPTERIDLTEATGRIAASTIRQYPPGIPEIIPGAKYSAQTINTLENAHKANVNIIGIDMAKDQKVDVVKELGNASDQLDIQVFKSQDIASPIADEIADFFRTSFSASPYFHFAFHESDPLQSLPHTLDFEAYAVSTALSNAEKRKNCQEALRGVAYEKAMKETSFPDLNRIHLPNGFHLWTDKELCRKHIKDRLSDPGYVTLVRDAKSGVLQGLLHSGMGSVERLFYTEEWSDPLLFSTYSDDKELADPKDFFEKIDYHFELKPHDPIMTISAQVLAPEIQGGDVFYQMIKPMAQLIHPNHAALPLLSEISLHGTAHVMNTSFTDRIVFGILKNTHPLVYCSQMNQALFLFTSEKKHWYHALRKAARENLEYRKKYYISHHTDHKAVKVKPNGELGLAVFATENIPAQTRIAVFIGEKYQSKTALGLPEIMRNHAIQIGPQEFVFGYKGLAHCLCHSCDPNCGIRNLTEIFTVRDIIAGEQLTWDYRCSENSNWVLEKCLCGTKRCTGKVANFDSLSSKVKAEYLSKSMVSEWICQNI